MHTAQLWVTNTTTPYLEKHFDLFSPPWSKHRQESLYVFIYLVKIAFALSDLCNAPLIESLLNPIQFMCKATDFILHRMLFVKTGCFCFQPDDCISRSICGFAYFTWLHRDRHSWCVSLHVDVPSFPPTLHCATLHSSVLGCLVTEQEATPQGVDLQSNEMAKCKKLCHTSRVQ